MIRLTKRYILVLLLIIPMTAKAQPDRGDVRSGNRAFSKGDIERAEEGYRRALEKDPESFFAKYNLGNALYKRGNSQEAERVVSSLTDSLPNEGVASKVFHNLGNYSLEQKKYSEAIDHYKSSLRVNPSDMETKANLAYAQKMLKEQQDKQDNKDDKDNKDNKDDKDNKENKDQQDNKDKQDNKDQQQNQPPPEITPQAAQQMLQAIQNKERETKEKMEKEKAKVMQSRQKEKNW